MASRIAMSTLFSVFALSVPGYASDCDFVARLKTTSATTDYSTIAAALAASTKGNTVYLGGSFTNEEVQIKDRADIRIISECSSRINGITISKSSNITIDGLTISTSKAGSPAVNIKGDNLRSSNIILVRNNISTDHKEGSGIEIGHYNQNVILHSNQIHACGSDGVFVKGKDASVTLFNNHVHNNGFNGIRMMGNSKVILSKNRIMDNGSRGKYYGVLRESVVKSWNCDPKFLLLANTIEGNSGALNSGSTAQLGNAFKICADLDNDKDGVADVSDNNPGIYNPDQQEFKPMPVFLGQTSVSGYVVTKEENLNFIVPQSAGGDPSVAKEGAVSLSDQAQVYVKSGSFQGTETLSLMSISTVDGSIVQESETEKIGAVYDFKVNGGSYNFVEPVEVTLKVSDTFTLDELPYVKLAIFNEQSQSWEDFGGSVNYQKRTITGNIPHFSWITERCGQCKIQGEVGDELRNLGNTVDKALADLNAEFNRFLENLKFAAQNCPSSAKYFVNTVVDFTSFVSREVALKGTSGRELFAAMNDAGAAAANATVNCTHSLAGAPHFHPTTPSTTLSNVNKQQLQKQIVAMHSKKVNTADHKHDALILCNGMVPEDLTHNKSGRPHCGTGDGMKFTGLMYHADPNPVMRDGILGSIAASGRPYRSPEDLAYNNEEGNTFSRDMFLGLLLYALKNGDRNTLDRVDEYVRAHFGMLCPAVHMDDGKPDPRCLVLPNTWRLFNDARRRLGAKDLLEPTAVEYFLLDESTKDAAEANDGFELHLVAVSILLRAEMGTITTELQEAAKTIYRRQSGNLFYQYINRLVNADSAPYSYDDIAVGLIKQMSDWNQIDGTAGYYNGNRNQWSYQRTDSDVFNPATDDKNSNGWQYLFLAKLLASDIEIRKERMDLSLLDDAPYGIYVNYSALSLIPKYVVHYPVIIKDSSGRVITPSDPIGAICTVYDIDGLERAILKGWNIVTQHFDLVSNSFAKKINEGICQPPIIAENPFQTSYTMSVDTGGYHNNSSPYKTITFQNVDGERECEAYCLIDGQCSSFGIFPTDGKNQCNLYENDNRALVKDAFKVTKLKIPRDVSFSFNFGPKYLTGFTLASYPDVSSAICEAACSQASTCDAWLMGPAGACSIFWEVTGIRSVSFPNFYIYTYGFKQ